VGGFTKRNLKGDVEDFAPKFGLSPQMEYRPARGALETEQSAVSFLRLAPGYRMSFGHHHERQEELYVLLSGAATLNLDGELVALEPLDAVRIAAATVRALEAGPDGCELLLFGAPNTGSGDAVTHDGWWGGP
jgi:mannose-6-phosphate isomerase-like protein (cupin superfamily)